MVSIESEIRVARDIWNHEWRLARIREIVLIHEQVPTVLKYLIAQNPRAAPAPLPPCLSLLLGQ
jgi:hypothetical protein